MDWLLMGAVFLLVSLSLVTLYGLTLQDGGSSMQRQAVFFFLGMGGLFFITRLDYNIWRSYSKVLYLITLLLLVLVLFFGSTIRGTRGWFDIFGFGVQPVELAKFSIIVYLAHYFSKYSRDMDDVKRIFWSIVGVGIPVFLVMLQPDFGSSLTLIGIWSLLLLIVGIPRLYLAIMLGSGVSVSLIAWFFMFKQYQKDRILAFLDPASDPLGRGYNVTQAAIAIGSGQVMGRGLAFGSQSQLRFLPETQTDFIFAVIGEEFGFLGVLFMLFLWGVIYWRLYVIASRTRSDFAMYLVLGFGALFLIQIIVNMGMNLGIMPVTGISLPFISYGGSFLVMSLLMIGVVQSIAIRR